MNDLPTLIFHTGIAKTSSELEGLDAVQAQTQESGEVFGGVAFILAASVFSKSYVKLPVATIFDAPVITCGGQILFCRKGLVIGDVVTDINRYLLGFLVSFNTSNLNDTR